MTVVNVIRGAYPSKPTDRENDRIEIPSSDFSVKIDGNLHKPAAVTNIEIENDGDTTTTQDQCGHTARTRTGNRGWVIRVQGIITGNDDRYGNLSMQMMRDVIASSDSIKVRSEVYSGEQTVSNTVITDANDLHAIETPDTEGEERAYEFQLQLGETTSS